MAESIHKIIAAINPDAYCEKDLVENESGKKVQREKLVKELVKEKGYLAAAKVAKPMEVETPTKDEIQFLNAFDKIGFKYPIQKYKVDYDVANVYLEPTYNWIIETMNRRYKKNIIKLIDNFASSPGALQFSEMGMKATKMQEEAMKSLGAVNQVVKSVLNLIYDLKEFKLRIAVYDDYHSKDKNRKSSALLSLKQVWMDNVDIKRGNTSVKAMAQQFDYATLIDAFMAVESPEKAKELDLNDRVKRIIEQRVSEFFRWIDISESELRKRFELEKNYLKSQINTVKLYARWIKPYLKSAKLLEQNVASTPWLVSGFNTNVFELTLLGSAKYKLEDDILAGFIPEAFDKLKFREIHFVGIVEIRFINMSDKPASQGGGFRGKLEVVMTSYALNTDEIKILMTEVEKDDFGDIFRALERATDESLALMRADIDEIFQEKEEDKKEESESPDVNPFTALFHFMKREKTKPVEKKSEEEIKIIKPDSDIEKIIRSQAILKARLEIYKLYSAFKKANNMPVF